MEFSYGEIIALMRKRYLIVLICTILGLCSFYVYNSYMRDPLYTASVQLYVSSDNAAMVADLSELTYAQKVVATYINFLQTKVFYSRVAEESGLNYSPGELKAMTEIHTVNNTEIFQIDITSKSQNDTYALAIAMQNVAPELIRSIKGNAQISVVDPPVFPGGPSGPNVMRNTLLGAVIGMLLALIAIILFELLDFNVKNQEDVIKKYKIPLLGTIPNFGNNFKKLSWIGRMLNKLNRGKSTVSNEKASKEVSFVVSEAYKSLRTNLRFTLRSEGCKIIVVSSPLPEEGKSTTSTNLAITISHTKVRTLLIDCDLRKGKLHKFFNMKSSPGVSEVLSGMIDVKDVIHNTSYDNLQVLFRGVVPPNATELTSSKQMEELIQKLSKSYDYIIIDSPPVNIVSDSLNLSKLADGVLIVLREKETSHPNVVTSIKKYELVKANILGLVLNGSAYHRMGNKSNYNYYFQDK